MRGTWVGPWHLYRSVGPVPGRGHRPRVTPCPAFVRGQVGDLALELRSPERIQAFIGTLKGAVGRAMCFEAHGYSLR